MVTSRGWNILAATRNLLSRYQQTSPSVRHVREKRRGRCQGNISTNQ
ncbi:unnamed protein product, partial [Musa acuminata subsp. burmannicoides]